MSIYETICLSNSRQIFQIYTKNQQYIDHKEHLHKFQKGNAVWLIFSDYNAIISEIFRNKRAIPVENVKNA